MKVETGDYLIVTGLEENQRNQFVQAQRVKSSYCETVLVDIDYGTKRQVFAKIPYDAILANCGQEPHIGRAFGLITQPLFHRDKVKGWGTVGFFLDLKDKQRARILRRITKLHKQLDKQKLDQFLPVTTEVREKMGRWSGYYKFQPSQDQDVIGYFPRDYFDNSLTEVLVHEVGHGIWFRQLDATDRAPMVELYHQCVNLEKVTDKQLQKLVKPWSQADSTKAYRKALDKDQLKLFAGCTAWIQQAHKLNLNNLESLVFSDYRKVLKLWPTQKQLAMSNVEPIVSDYGATKPEEFFAEAFMMYWLEQELPRKVRSAVSDTLKVARRNGRVV